MNRNGFATIDNSAWLLVKGVRTILLWVGAISVIGWIACHVPDWLDEMEAAKEKCRQEEIQKIEAMIKKQVDHLWGYYSSLSDEIRSLEKQLEGIEVERKKEKIILKELEERQNRSADEATQDALSDFI